MPRPAAAAAAAALACLILVTAGPHACNGAPEPGGGVAAAAVQAAAEAIAAATAGASGIPTPAGHEPGSGDHGRGRVQKVVVPSGAEPILTLPASALNSDAAAVAAEIAAGIAAAAPAGAAAGAAPQPGGGAPEPSEGAAAPQGGAPDVDKPRRAPHGGKPGGRRHKRGMPMVPIAGIAYMPSPAYPGSTPQIVTIENPAHSKAAAAGKPPQPAAPAAEAPAGVDPAAPGAPAGAARREPLPLPAIRYHDNRGPAEGGAGAPAAGAAAGQAAPVQAQAQGHEAAEEDAKFFLGWLSGSGTWIDFSLDLDDDDDEGGPPEGVPSYYVTFSPVYGVEVWEIDPRYWPPTYEYGEYDDEFPPGWYPPFDPAVPPTGDYEE